MAAEFVTLAWRVRAVTSDDEWGTEKEEAYDGGLAVEEKVVEPETENQQTMLQNSTNGLLRARRIGVLSAPPIGCAITDNSDWRIGKRVLRKVQLCSQVVQFQALKEHDSLQNSSKSRIVYIDVYNPLLDIIQNYQNYGNPNLDRGCCGTGKLEVAVLCNPLDATCSNASECVYRKLVIHVLQKYMNQLF
ncbi:hypothetical protein PHAVU_011G143400 [Phaseolus vulgaris]|uniref:Uncharacterized protein n=1 Tax=Phaseolus vulgaris TaxID=3885 RepID=V7AHA2_PHAVU|nr:hypothetical protein PHAVU_011G143400g [Phaseolus vulgaris]ESW05002.1 hypothetical protein PHAVU_011G143400g [Phaseolus vulgaris]